MVVDLHIARVRLGLNFLDRHIAIDIFCGILKFTLIATLSFPLCQSAATSNVISMNADQSFEEAFIGTRKR